MTSSFAPTLHVLLLLAAVFAPAGQAWATLAPCGPQGCCCGPDAHDPAPSAAWEGDCGCETPTPPASRAPEPAAPAGAPIPDLPALAPAQAPPPDLASAARPDARPAVPALARPPSRASLCVRLL